MVEQCASIGAENRTITGHLQLEQGNCDEQWFAFTENEV